MARKRSLSPTIWEDPSINQMSRDARLAFIGIISNADDDGYLRGDCGSLKRLIFGFDENEDKTWYEELKKFKGLHFFEIENEIYVHLKNWEKWQTQRDDRRQASTYPKCPQCRTLDGQVSDTCQLKLREVKRSKDKGREEGAGEGEGESLAPLPRPNTGKMQFTPKYKK